METTGQQLRALEDKLGRRRQRTRDIAQSLKKASLDEREAELRLDAAITRIAKNECLQLTNMMCLKLPAELREVVYRYLCVEDQPIPVGPYYHFREYECSPETGDSYITLPDGRIKYDHSKKVPGDFVMPTHHIFDEDYTGTTIAPEVTRFYYSHNIFSVCNIENGIETFLRRPGMLDGIVGDDISLLRSHTFAEMVEPMHFVRNLQIRIKCEHFRNFLEAAMGDASYSEEMPYERNFLRTTRDQLVILYRLPSLPPGLNLEFVIMTAFEDTDEDSMTHLTNLLQAMRNLIYTLKHDRTHTTVKVLHHDEIVSAFPRDLTWLWSLTKDQWEHENDAHYTPDFLDWTFRFHVGEVFHELDWGACGIPREELSSVIKERWGVDDLFRDKELKRPIKEGRYWPVYSRDG